MISGTLSNVLSPASVSITTALHLFESTLIRRVAAYYQGQALTIRIHTATASLYSQYFLLLKYHAWTLRGSVIFSPE